MTKAAATSSASGKPPQLVFVDATKLEATGTVSLPGPADICAYSQYFDRVFVDNDDKPEQWMVNPNSEKIDGTNTFVGGGMEDLSMNREGDHVVQNIKDTSEVAVLFYRFPTKDSPEKKAKLQVSTLPAEKPHGLALVDDNKVLIAGGNGKLVLLDYKKGKVIASTDIAPRVDEIAYNPTSGDAYCASGTGVISVVSVGDTQLGHAQTVTSSQGAHSIAVDPKTNSVWIAFAKDDKPFVQRFDVQLR